jgi:hypothetical protein
LHLALSAAGLGHFIACGTSGTSGNYRPEPADAQRILSIRGLARLSERRVGALFPKSNDDFRHPRFNPLDPLCSRARACGGARGLEDEADAETPEWSDARPRG